MVYEKQNMGIHIQFNNVSYDNMNGTREHYAKWNMSRTDTHTVLNNWKHRRIEWQKQKICQELSTLSLFPWVLLRSTAQCNEQG